MIKFSSDTNETGDGELRHEKTMLYLNSKMINVFFNGIEKETYLELIEHRSMPSTRSLLTVAVGLWSSLKSWL